MKSILLLFACSVFITSSAQKYNVTTNVNMYTGVGQQACKFKNAYGFGLGLETAIKNASPLKLVVNVEAGINGIKSMPYEFEYRNVLTKTSIEYNSSILILTSGLRYVINESKNWVPYVGVGIGLLRNSTSYTIEDPKNPDGCHALEEDKIMADNAFIGKIEGGLRYTSPLTLGNRNVLFDAGFSYIKGTTAEYMRLGNHHNTEGPVYSVKFQNAANEVHEHAIGKMYNTPVHQLGFHIGMVVPFGF